jgi:murein DD-endopeptidase MepM/ murein hydrolase activator NlpD
LVQIQHDNGDVTYYGHCSELLVQEGDRVYQGQVIACMGATGVASGVHLHFEIRQDGTPIDPETVLP